MQWDRVQEKTYSLTYVILSDVRQPLTLCLDLGPWSVKFYTLPRQAGLYYDDEELSLLSDLCDIFSFIINGEKIDKE